MKNRFSRVRVALVVLVALGGGVLYGMPKQDVGGCQVGCQKTAVTPPSSGDHLQDESEDISVPKDNH